jgi:hypothetical protein
MINTLFGGPSEADLMRAAMEVVHDKESDLENNAWELATLHLRSLFISGSMVGWRGNCIVGV